MRIRFLTLLSFVCCSFSFAQVFSADSLHSPVDSLHTDSLHTVKDSSSVKGIDTVVTYTCTDSIVYTLSNKTMSLYKKGDIKYQQMQLQSERIHVNWNTSVMTAEGIPDSADTTKKKFKGTPIMKDGGEEFHGFELGYNFKTKKGKINVADTHSDEGYYHGEDIKKVEQDVLFIENGRYTTCDAPEPHYYFASPKMKVLLRDKVIAQPVYFYIADVPLFALPLGVFPSKGGRRSGIIAPAIVEDAAHGRLLRHLGYYFAISDYMDINFRSDLYTKGSWALYSDYRYNLRYYFNGSLSGEYKKLIEGESADPARSVNEAYSLNFTHSQVIDPTASFNVNFTFASNNSYLNTINQNQLLNQSIRSQATLNKLWDEKNSSSISVTRTQNLVDGSVFETLPSLSFSHSGSYPFRFGRKVAADLSDLSWYETIVFSYSANASNNRSKFTRKINGIKTDINGVLTPQTIEETEHDNNQNLSQSLGFGISPKLGYFTISPNLSYSDQRSFSSNEVPGRNDADSSIIFTTVRQSSRTGIITSGISIGTKVYGIVQPGIFGIAAIRHTLTPSLFFTYNKQVIGTSFSPMQMLMGLNVGNVFEMKTISSEVGKEGSKIQLLNLGMGISYNFAADSLNLSLLNMDFRTQVGNMLNIGGSAVFDPYKLVPNALGGYSRINTLVLKDEGRLARLTSFSLNLSTSFSGEKKQSASQPARTDSTSQQRLRTGYVGLYQDEDPDFSIPWRLALQLNYSESKAPFSSRSAGLRGSLEFNLTENWKFGVSGGYDIVNKEVVVPNVNISRDLHCWLMNFTWIPLGLARSYQLEIRVKAPQLHDIKVTKQGSDRGIY